ncbi:hypothetical protein Y032_0198g1618 [Ancylostoma ceylanicum]|uniref:SSD domain-containing protein n=1 Tax=Ancylostoma ceylanicum TaxID=53326 RepID=A0A016SN31_9BILA|nr:hypothetical protein Y032_0198g1618 [Ancylostoma ceylanicum]
MLLSSRFGQLGTTVGARPLTFFLSSVALFVISVLLLIAVPPEVHLNFDEGYTTPHAPSIRELHTQMQFFGTKGKPWYMALFAEPRDQENGSMIESTEFDEFKSFYKRIKSNVVIRQEGNRTITYMDYCGKTCDVNDPIFKTHALSFFGLQWPETSIFMYKSNVGKYFFLREMRGNEIVKSRLTALYFIAFLNNTQAMEDLRHFEAIVSDHVAKHNADKTKVTTITQHSARGMQMEIARGMKFVFGKLIGGVFLAGIVMLLCFLVLNRIHERCNGRVLLLSFGATFLPIMALITAASFCSFIGIHTNTLTIIAPALAFAIGIDGMLILYNAWISHHKTSNVKDHMTEVFSSCFPSITIASSVALGLIFGGMYPTEEFAIFSFYLGLSVVFVYAYLIFYFPALMVWCSSIETHLPLPQHCAKSPKVVKQRPWYEAFLGQYAECLSHSAWLKIFAVSLFCLCLALPTYMGSSKIHANIDYRHLLPPDSPNNKGVHFMSDVVWFEFFNVLYFIEKPPRFDDPQSYQRFKHQSAPEAQHAPVRSMLVHFECVRVRTRAARALSASRLDQAGDLFTHTWSLCVEMQFYLLVPTVFLFYQIDHILFRWLYLSTVIATSFCYYMVSGSNVSFNSVFSRIWQFGVGISAYVISESESYIKEEVEHQILEESGESESMHRVPISFKWGMKCIRSETLFHCLLIAMGALTLSPFIFHSHFLRISITLGMGIILALGSAHQCGMLNQRWLVYLGDISYALYLVHWPVYVWTKFHYDRSSGAVFFVACSCVVVAALISSTFERYYLSLSYPGVLFLVTSMYAAIAFIMYNQEQISLFLEKQIVGSPPTSELSKQIPTNLTIEEAIRMNAMFDRNEYKNLVPPRCHPNNTEHGFCVFESQGLKGSLNMMIVGNSYAPNVAEIIYDSFAGLAKNISKYSRSRCEVLVIGGDNCRKSYLSYKKYVEEVRPDVLFIICRAFEMDTPILGTVTMDPLFLEAKATLEKYNTLVRTKIFVLDSTPGVDADHIKKLNAWIRNGNITGVYTYVLLMGTQLYKFSMKLHRKNSANRVRRVIPRCEMKLANQVKNRNYLNGMARHAELAKSCAKCHFFNYIDALSDESGEVLLSDPNTKLSFFTGGSHLTAAGLDRIRPIYVSLAQNFSFI